MYIIGKSIITSHVSLLCSHHYSLTSPISFKSHHNELCLYLTFIVVQDESNLAHNVNKHYDWLDRFINGHLKVNGFKNKPKNSQITVQYYNRLMKHSLAIPFDSTQSPRTARNPFLAGIPSPRSQSTSPISSSMMTALARMATLPVSHANSITGSCGMDGNPVWQRLYARS